MGSGASDLQKVSHSTLHDELTQERRTMRQSHESIGVKNACTSKAQEHLGNLFEHMETAYKEYDEIFKKRSADGHDDEDLMQAVAKVNDHYCAYQRYLESSVYEVGDIVQVRDKSLGALFVEGVVVVAANTTIEVHLDNDDEGYLGTDGEDASAVPAELIRVDISAGEVRKVKSWTTLEVGDRVRVKDGCLAFQGIVLATSDDGTEVTVSFSAAEDQHGIDDDLEYEDEGNEGEVYPRHLVEKIDTGRIAKIRFKDTVRRVQKSLTVASAFKHSIIMSPRSPSPRTEISSPVTETKLDEAEEKEYKDDAEIAA